MVKFNIINEFKPTNKNEQQIQQVKFIDLFCGIGSFHYSFEKLGFKCVMASDICESAKNTYKQNYGMDVLDDICEIDPSKIEDYDILCAGFPCQPFSQAGHHKGFEDSRGTMFSQVMRFVKQNIPKVVILENVQALLNHDNGNSFATIKTELENEGYTVLHNVLKCSDYGIPQMRKRLFIIGFKNIDVHNLDKFFNLNEYKKNTTLTEYLGQNFKKDIAYTLRCGGKHSPIDDRHNWDGYWVDDKEYRLTLDDGLKLQGFHNYNLIGNNNEKWKLLGNTIPTIFTEIIGKQLIKHTSFHSNM
jgi:DNA (cytosine-5)-methyltransferase 1